jgi:mRNA interferase RelE/StbE
VKYEASKAFNRDVDAIRHPKLLRQLREAVAQIGTVGALADLPNVTAINGHKNAFRIKLGDYRLGCRLEEPTVVLARFLHRKEIYRYFP